MVQTITKSISASRQAVDGRMNEFSVGADEFAKMEWHYKHLGPIATIEPNSKDHFRNAIQKTSACRTREVVFKHLGWRKIEGRWVFLHGDGFIDAERVGECPSWPGYSVRPERQLEHFRFEFVPRDDQLIKAVRSSLSILDVAGRHIGLVLLSATYRSVVGPCHFSIWMHGQTGTGKSELASLCQRHFGRNMDAKTLPLSWVDTANSMEVVAFSAKDCLTVADDYNGQVTVKSVDRFLRAQGNAAGRTRLTSDSRVISGKFPRGLSFCTAEDVPMEHSGVARCVLVELPLTSNEGGVDWARNDSRPGFGNRGSIRNGNGGLHSLGCRRP